ncbi:MAG TPA: alpha/beta fold hydrolase [Albitalea sp.]|nr:alpha/beta fold hydrolase [Albitalea sp.]
MPKRRRPPADTPTPPAAGLYAPALKTGVQATTTRVQEMHHAIAGKTFDTLQKVPGLALPTRAVQGAHDAIANGVYAAVRHGAAALLSLAGQAEQRISDPARMPKGKELAIRSALNGVFGDALQAQGSALAVTMGFHSADAPLPLTRAALAGLGERVCVFVHGLACDERSWFRSGSESYGSLLAADLGITPIYLRYNTGLPVADNGQQFAALLQQFVRLAPRRLRELVLVGHSMGGLVARDACERAAVDASPWLDRVTMVVCIGSPHQGSPIEQVGRLAAGTLDLFKVTQPLARVANARSQGIKDLRHGRRGQANVVPLRFIAGSLADEADGLVATAVGKLLGDGLVTRHSASDDGLGGDVERVELEGIGHMTLLSHPRVYAELRAWLER